MGKCGVMCGDTGNYARMWVMYEDSGRCGAIYGDTGSVGNFGSCMGIRGGVRKCGVTYGDM